VSAAALLDQLIQFIAAHPYVAYAAVFIAAWLEAVPVFGAFVPGSTVIIALSALVAAGELNLTGVLASAIIGAVIGDGAAYLVGHRYQRRILETWPLNVYPAIVTRSEDFFQRYGTLAVLFARFVPPVRAFVPVIAGALGMPMRRFFPVNVIAVCLWACAHILPGALAGSLWKQYGRDIEHIALPVIAVVIVVWAGVWLIRRRKQLTAD
jgi:membrane-associated protein